MRASVIPRGYCQCGCGEKTSLASRNRKSIGWVKGEPVRFINGHYGKTRLIQVQPVVEDRGHETPCWIWQGTKLPAGYGLVRVEGAQIYAHRHYYELEHGPIPEGLHIDHLCRIPSCVNPAHLEAVTPAENTKRGHAARRSR